MALTAYKTLQKKRLVNLTTKQQKVFKIKHAQEKTEFKIKKKGTVGPI